MGVCAPSINSSIGRISLYSTALRPTSGDDFYIGKVIWDTTLAQLFVLTSLAAGGTWTPIVDDAPIGYTPTLTNVTGGTTAGQYQQTGKALTLAQQITVGTATAGAAITLSLPAGLTSAPYIQVVDAIGPVLTTVTAIVNASDTKVTVYKTAAGGNWVGADSLVNVRVNGVIFLT